MYRRSGAASCPSCQGIMQMLHETVFVAGCGTCGGVWLGPDATMHVMQGLGDPVETEVAALSLDTARRSLHPAAPDSGARGCPMCGFVMAHVPVAEVVVDSCPSHGTFFDRDEVADVVSACHRLRAQRDLRARSEEAGATAVTTKASVGLLEHILRSWLDLPR